ncbi:MAG: hypothetical protein ACXVAX_05800 [Pseudobdellovibrio sp.]
MSKKVQDRPFDLLLEEITKTTSDKSFDKQQEATRTHTGTGTSAGKLNFGSLLKSNNKRRNDRIATTGFVNIFDETGKPLTRGVLRNISPGGFGIECYAAKLPPKTKIIAEISGTGVVLGKFFCIVSWTEILPDSPEKSMLVGFDISTTDKAIKVKFEQFVSSLKVAKRTQIKA